MNQVFEGIDDESSQLIIRLQLEDSENISSALLSGQQEDALEADPRLALAAVRVFEEDMQRNASILHDRQYAEEPGRSSNPGKFIDLFVPLYLTADVM